jgi:4-hydroxybenzoate polyprenyltransferase
MRRQYGQAVLVLSLLFVGLGIALLVQTVRSGGGVGYVVGVLFIALGIGRLYLQLKRRGGRT